MEATVGLFRLRKSRGGNFSRIRQRLCPHVKDGATNYATSGHYKAVVGMQGGFSIGVGQGGVYIGAKSQPRRSRRFAAATTPPNLAFCHVFDLNLIAQPIAPTVLYAILRPAFKANPPLMQPPIASEKGTFSCGN